MVKKEFITALGKKLKLGNLRDIHLNALPGRYATRLDLFELNIINPDLPRNFIELLSNNAAIKFEISFGEINLNQLEQGQRKKLNLIARKLDSICYENNDYYLDHGIKTFGFGYPLLIKRCRDNPSRIIKAPLFIWNLDIEKSPRVQNSWRVTREEDFSFSINELLISHLKNDENINIEVNDEIFENGIFQYQNILSYTKSILKQLNTSLPIDSLKIKIEECALNEDIDRITSNLPWVSWAGVFGLYRTKKQSIIKDINILLNDLDKFSFENLKIEKINTSSISAVPTDPSQEQIINSLFKSYSKIIQGPPGTGKSQSLTAIITNALSHGLKCLIVCEKKTALDVIYNNLEKIGLRSLCAVIDDINNDRKKIIDKVRLVIENNSFVNFRSYEYEDKIKQFEKLKAELNRKQKAVTEKIFGDNTWKDIIGEYLRCSKKLSKENIKDKLKSNQYKYEFEEYKRLEYVIKEGKQLFKNIKSINHPLSILNFNIFKERYLFKYEMEIKKKVEDCYSFTKKLMEFINSTESIFGNAFSKNSTYSNFLISSLSIFSKKYKKLERDKKWINNSIIKLYKFHRNTNFFNFNWPPKLFKCHYWEIYSLLNNYLDKLSIILNNFQDFRSYHEWSYFLNSLSETEKQLIYALIEYDVNDWFTIFNKWYLNQVLMKYEQKIGPFLNSSNIVEELLILKSELMKLITQKILKLWDEKRKAAINNFQNIHQGNITSLYNYRKNKEYGRKNSLRKIVQTDFELFTSFFPVLLVNPIVCSSIFPMKEGLFDIVIFDEASQLRLEDVFSAYLRGKYKIISGDKHQMPPSDYFIGSTLYLDEDEKEDYRDEENGDNIYEDSNDLASSESLLKYAENSLSTYSYLDFHYRSRHPYLIEFSNAAFYGNRLVPMPPKINYKPIHLFKVNGLYSKRTNQKEAEKVVDILFNQLKTKKDGNYPSIGVATFNIEQRNLILDLLHQYSLTSNENSEKLVNLKKNGLFVKNLENIQGDEKDIIIISTTFGYNEDGVFRQNFGPINQEKGYRLLNVIITRAKAHLLLITSIPGEYYSKYRQEIETKGNVRKGIFYAYLAYAEAIENNNNDRRLAILELLTKHSHDSQQKFQDSFIESPFEQEVYDYLVQYIDKNRIISQYKFGGFRIDFVIKSNNGAFIALECDGKKYHASEQAYAYDTYRQQILEDHGFKVYRIWSTNWWLNPNEEINKLMRYIEEIDKKEPAPHRPDHAGV